jgi:hypothetical protein
MNAIVRPVFTRCSGAALLLLLSFLLAPSADGKRSYPHYTYILPDGYVGWIQVIFNDPRAPHLQLKDGGYVIDVPESGIPRTSALLVHDSNPKRKDLFYYRSANPGSGTELRPVPPEYVMPGDLHSGFSMMDTDGKGPGYSLFIFIGPPELRAKVPFADWDKYVAEHPKSHGGKMRIEWSAGEEEQTPSRKCPKNLRSGLPASGVEGFPEPVARWTLDRV